VQLELTPVGIGELAERALVASTGTSQRLLDHARILPPTRPLRAITTNDVAPDRNSPLNFARVERLN
jgi:hypothetical protein